MNYLIPVCAIFLIFSYFFIDRPLTEWISTLDPRIIKGAGIVDSLFDVQVVETVWPIIFYVYVILLGKKTFKNDFLFIILAVPCTLLVLEILKVVIGRARPELWLHEGIYGFQGFTLNDAWQSFPSRHAATTAGLMAAFYCFAPRWVVFYVLIAFIVAALRVVSLDHYLSDVFGGVVLAFYIVRTLFIPFQRWVAKSG